MFSKSKINEQSSTTGNPEKPSEPAPASTSGKPDFAAPNTPRPKAPPSTLSSDLVVTGNMKTTGDIQVEGKVEGDIRAHLLTVGETAVIKGEIIADDIVVTGHVIGKVRGLKVRLTSSARVEGDIIHKTIAIESGAHFEGSVQRQDDPLNSGTGKGSTPPPSAIAKKPETAKS